MTTGRYPSGWDKTAYTHDGAEFLIRPIRPADADRERDFIAALSAESSYNRFMHVMREASPSFVRQMVTVDYDRTMAFIALVGEGNAQKIIGIARYAAKVDEKCDCEFAVAVADEWQSRGVGTALMRLLFDYCRSQGFIRTHGIIFASNAHMVELAHDLGLVTQHVPGDCSVLEASGKLQ
jgi:acetyltransferase